MFFTRVDIECLPMFTPYKGIGLVGFGLFLNTKKKMDVQESKQNEEGENSCEEEEEDLSDDDEDTSDDEGCEEQEEFCDLSEYTSKQVRDIILKDLSHVKKKGESFKVKKTSIRALCMYFKDEIVAAGCDVAILIDEQHIKPWSNNFDDMKLGESGLSHYWGYIANTIRFFLLCGHYESILILLPNAETNTPAAAVEHIISFCNFRFPFWQINNIYPFLINFSI